MITIDICAYCSSMGDETPKRVTVWEETGELVCMDCRVEFVEQEFEEPTESKLNFQDICDNLGVPNFTNIF